MKNLFFFFPFLQWFITRIRWKKSKLLSMDSFSNMKVCFVPWIQNNEDKIISSILCRNPNAIPLLEENQDKIDWY